MKQNYLQIQDGKRLDLHQGSRMQSEVDNKL